MKHSFIADKHKKCFSIISAIRGAFFMVKKYKKTKRRCLPEGLWRESQFLMRG